MQTVLDFSKKKTAAFVIRVKAGETNRQNFAGNSKICIEDGGLLQIYR
jgi:hypothetical protein